ncbi:MAG TPA: hypothetical protein VGD92_00365 [Sphingobacteriaceae bacterium]
MLIDKLVRRVKALGLNLQGKVVLTEAATGPYVVTPILAALAGARVFAYTRSTVYGSVRQVIRMTREVYQPHREDLDIHFIDQLTPEIIAQADVITNSGHLRPLNRELLQHARDSAVIPLMYEAWEWRSQDMDLDYIRERGFRIGATNERHAEVDVFSYLGDMAVKQIFDAGLCLHNNTFVLVCNNDFGPYIARVVSRMCRKLGVIDLPQNRTKYRDLPVEWLSDFPDLSIPPAYRDAEAVIFTAYPFDLTWLGKDTPLSPLALKENLQNPLVLQYAGDVDTEMLAGLGIRCFPGAVKSGHMGILPSGIGYDAIIRLQAGGLKVAEGLLAGKYRNNPYIQLL